VGAAWAVDASPEAWGVSAGAFGWSTLFGFQSFLLSPELSALDVPTLLENGVGTFMT
jgi:hypothetical protein